MTEVRQQLRNQNLGDVEPSSFATVGSRVFPDASAIPDLKALVDIVDGYRAAHVVAYGGPIGGTEATVTHAMQTDAVEAVYTPQNREVAQIMAVQVENGGGAPMTADLYIGGVHSGLSQININPSDVMGFNITSPIYVASSVPLQIKIVTGTVADATAKAAYILCGV